MATMTSILPIDQNQYDLTWRDCPQVLEQSQDSLLGKRKRSRSSEEASNSDTKRKRRKTSRDFTREEFVALMHLTQREAAKALDICLSTFKRQFSHLRPKLTWPTPSERQNLIRRKRFENIIKQNEAEKVIATKTFEFGKSDDLFDGEFFPTVDSLLEHYQLQKKENQELKRALNKQVELEQFSLDDTTSSPTLYGGDIFQYEGAWNARDTNAEGLALLDIDMAVVASNPKFNSLVGKSDMSAGVNFSSLYPKLHQQSTHMDLFKVLIMKKEIQTIQWTDTLVLESGEAQHVSIEMHSQGGCGAWISIRKIDAMQPFVLIDGISYSLMGLQAPKRVSEMSSFDNLVHHMKVFQVIKDISQC